MATAVNKKRRAAAVATEPNRAGRRKRETRRKLLDAAQTLMARQGIDATTIQQITDEADVGFGSFYNYFASKDAIVEAICAETIESFGDALDTIGEHVDDYAEVLSASIRYVVGKGSSDEKWGWFLIRTAFAAPSVELGLLKRMSRDLHAGLRSGRFKTDNEEATNVALGGIALSVIGSRLRGVLDDRAPELAATMALRMLGLSDEEAAEISRRPLPPIG